MKVTALLADAVAVAEGKLYVHGGGWQLVPSLRLPTVLPNLGVGMIIDFAVGELVEPHRVVLRMRDADGRLVPLAHDATEDHQAGEQSDQIIAELAAMPPGGDEAVAATLVFAFNIQRVTLDHDTQYELEIAIDAEVRERLPLAVKLVRPNTD